MNMEEITEELKSLDRRINSLVTSIVILCIALGLAIFVTAIFIWYR